MLDQVIVLLSMPFVHTLPVSTSSSPCSSLSPLACMAVLASYCTLSYFDHTVSGGCKGKMQRQDSFSHLPLFHAYCHFVLPIFIKSGTSMQQVIYYGSKTSRNLSLYDFLLQHSTSLTRTCLPVAFGQ